MRVYHRVTSTAGSIKPRRRGWDFQLRERARECAVLVRGAVLCERACVPCIVFIFIVVFVRPAYKIWARRRRRGTRIIPARLRSWIPFRVIGVQATFKPHKCAPVG